MKKVLLSLLMAIACVPMAFGQVKSNDLVVTDTSVCGGLTWIDGHTYTSDTTALWLNDTVAYVLHLTVIPPVINLTDTAEASGKCIATWNHKVWRTAGNFVDTLKTSRGCDSIITVRVTLTNRDTVNLRGTHCGYYATSWGDTLRNSITCTDSTITTTNGCSVLATLNLTINPTYKMPLERDTAACSYRWNNMTITDTNVHTRTLRTTKLCDSILSVQVFLTHEQYDTVDLKPCDYYVNGTDTLRNDTIFTTVDTSSVCHIFTTTRLVFDHAHRDSTNVVVRDTVGGCSIVWLGHTFTYEDVDTTVYAYDQTAAGHCDSLAAIHITAFDSINRVNLNIENCGHYYWHGDTLKNSCTRQFIDTSAANCTTIETLTLTLIALHDTATAEACETYTYAFDSRDSTSTSRDRETFNVPGQHTYDTDLDGDTLYSINKFTKCKTYHTLVLNIIAVDTLDSGIDVDTTVCDLFSYSIDGRATQYIDHSTDTIVLSSRRTTDRCYNMYGHIKVVVNKKTYKDYNVTECDSYTWDFTGITYTSSTTATKTLSDTTDIHGCDSVGRLNLTINYTPVVRIEGDWNLNSALGENVAVLKAVYSDSNNTFTWYKDNVQFHTGVGAAGDSVSVTVNKNTDIHLTTTSPQNCTANNWVTITYTVGIDEAENTQVNLYPNPASRYLNVESAEGIREVTIYNSVGQQALMQSVNNSHATLDLNNLATGTYTMRIVLQNGEQTTRKFIVNK